MPTLKMPRGERIYFEKLPDDFVVYRSQASQGIYNVRSGGTTAKNAVTNCCELQPIKYFPDGEGTDRWWLLCPGCKYAIKANGNCTW
jgi:hypothetical protein